MSRESGDQKICVTWEAASSASCFTFTSFPPADLLTRSRSKSRWAAAGSRFPCLEEWKLGLNGPLGSQRRAVCALGGLSRAADTLGGHSSGWGCFGSE